jgi:UDP-3-O-[3-hydroxymyristoyl] N-acetylglucosamine deacetylase
LIINRQTIGAELAIEGKGLHSGQPVIAKLFPSSEGIQFKHGSDIFEATPGNVTDTSRCTVLGTIRTVEHIMSALAGLAITDVRIELSYPELPGLDGSALGYVNAIKQSGTEALDPREAKDIYARLFVQTDNLKIAVGKGSGHWRYDFITDERWPGVMTFETLDVAKEYETQIAPARTTVFSDEIEQVKAAGLGQGLDESSVLIIGEKGFENGTRFDNEPARHKLLDLIGDLYLAGVPINQLNVVGYRSGHRRNVEMAKLLFDSCRTP